MTTSDRPDPERKTTDPQPARGPVPVRDVMKPASAAPESSAPAEDDASRDEPERGFEMEDGAWIVRAAGAGAYGTGRAGRAMLVAVHFFREDDPGTPVREALVPAGVFPQLRSEELRALFVRATPIDLER